MATTKPICTASRTTTSMIRSAAEMRRSPFC